VLKEKAEIVSKTRAPTESEPILREVEQGWRRLSDEFPANVTYKSRLQITNENLGRLYEAIGNPREAERLFSSSLQIAEELSRAEPDNAVHLRNVAGLRVNHANRTAQTSPANAIPHYDQAIGELERALSRGADPLAKEFLGNAHLGRARTLVKLQRDAESLASWDRAIEAAKGKASASTRRAERAAVLADLGRLPEAIAEFEELVKEPGVRIGTLLSAAGVHTAAASKEADPSAKRRHEDRAIELLRQAHAKGSKTVQKLGEDDNFAPLRSRPEFQSLLEEAKRQGK
jgi:tetratricopeptide (TPR) repeat protein